MIESSLLSCCMRDKDSFMLALKSVSHTDFVEQINSEIFKSLAEYYLKLPDGDDGSLAYIHVLQRTSATSEYVADLMELNSPLINVGEYVSALLLESDRLKLSALAGVFAAEIVSSSVDLSAAVDELQNEVSKIRLRSGARRRMRTFTELYKDFQTNHERASESPEDMRIPTGFVGIDAMIGGLTRGGLHVIAAPTGVGKTTFALNIAQYVAFNLKKRVDIFSLEMSADDIFIKMLSSYAGISGSKMGMGLCSSEDLSVISNKLTTEICEEQDKLVGIHDITDVTVESVSAELLNQSNGLEKDIGLVVVDYLQLIKSTGESFSRNEEVAKISRELKLLAMKINAPVIAISQLSRKHSSEKREGHKFLLSDLRDSGAIEQDADTIMFINRDPRGNDSKSTTVNIAKSRRGGEGDTYLEFDGNKNRFISVNMLPNSTWAQRI